MPALVIASDRYAFKLVPHLLETPKSKKIIDALLAETSAAASSNNNNLYKAYLEHLSQGQMAFSTP